jgi:YD repeat-containing protein
MNKNRKKYIVVVISSLFVTLAIGGCNSNAKGGSSSGGSNLVGQSGAAADVTEQSWKYTYTTNHLLETATDPNGNVTRYDYDAEGNLIKITNPLKQIISFSDFEKHGNPQTIIDQNGITTKLSYTPRGWLATTTTDGAITRLFYDNVGNLTKLILPDETTFSYVYDDARYLSEIQAPYGTIKYTRDNAGNITKQDIDGGVYSEQRTYDEINRLLKITTAISTQTFSYDNDDNLATSTDGRNNKTSLAWDELQRLTQVTDAKNGATKYGYDNTQSIEDPTSITDAKGTNTLYKYNGLRNLLSLASPDSGTHTYSAHDGNGNLLEQTDARGQLISYSYDQLKWRS